MTTTSSVTLADGRRVAVHVVAEGSTDRTVVFCHSAPGSGAFDPDPEATWARGVTLIGVDRPGYGGSDPARAGTWAGVDRAADDLAEVLDALGTGPVGVAGWSAGGRVALALAARRPDLVDRVVVIGTPAPDDQVNWMTPAARGSFDEMRGQPPEQVHEAIARMLGAALPEDPLSLLGATDADADALARPGARERLADMVKNALAQGMTGLAADIAGYCLRPWGFEPGEVRAKTLLIHGAKDPIAGPRHAKWYQPRLPDARFEQVPGAGHLVVLPKWERVLSHLAPGRKR
jgi:pimeloyl-ACP methyl ester carboxylesterase